MAGLGFLCAGTILKSGDLAHVRGLTTAAGIWLTAAIGIAAGMGREATAVLATVLAVIILFAVPALIQRLERWIGRPPAQDEDTQGREKE